MNIDGHLKPAPMAASQQHSPETLNTPISSFQYPPLDDPTRQTRLICFESGDKSSQVDTEPIRCRLIVVNLDACASHEYHALSYCWGDVTDARPIHVNDNLHYITSNLEAALHRAIEINRDRLVWADAICINQRDLEEKASQVNLMASIFTMASCCLIWLGDTTTEPDYSPNTIYEPDAKKAFSLIESLARDEHYTRPGNREEGSLAPLMKLTWWHRIWTVQEAILPPYCVAMCGSLTLPWATFMQASTNFRRHHYKMCCNRAVSSLKEFNNKIKELEDTRREMVSDSGTDMNRIFQKFQDRNATDPRDKVFGLLALGATSSSGLTIAAGLSADYSASNPEIFVQTALKLIRQTRVLDLLLRAREYDRNPHLPSWVPDWRAKNDRHRTRELSISKWSCWDLHSASGGRRTEFGDSNAITFPANTLVLAGVKVDTITVVGYACEDREAFTAPPESSIFMYFPDKQWRQLMEETVPADENYPLGSGSYSEALMRVLALDYVEDYDGSENCVIRRRIAPSEVAACLREVRSGNQRQTYFQSKMINHRFFITQSGLLGLGPVDVAKGDEVFILLGGNMPFILRKKNLPLDVSQASSLHTLVGDAYVHGIMDGEYADETRKQWVYLI